MVFGCQGDFSAKNLSVVSGYKFGFFCEEPFRYQLKRFSVEIFTKSGTVPRTLLTYNHSSDN